MADRKRLVRAFIVDNLLFGEIRLEDDEVVPENLDSLNLIDRFLEKKLGRAAEPVGLPS